MRIVSNKEELNNAIKAGEKHFLCKGELAEELRRRYGIRKVAKRGFLAIGLAAAACLVTAPFSGGTSLIGLGALAGAGAVATGLTVGSVTITTTELAIICGTVLVIIGHKVHITFNNDGTINMDID